MGAAGPMKRQRKARNTADSFQNFQAATGINTGNLTDGSTYGFNPVSRNRVQLEWMYRGSWIAGQAIDTVAEDMTREGVEVNCADQPEKIQKLDAEIERLQIWAALCQTIKWARLYGGAVALMLIDGQKTDTPLRTNTISKGQFRGLMPIDRWALQPSLADLVQEPGPDFGKPKYYDTVTDMMSGLPRMRIHYSRVVRIDGVDLPYWQKISENLWGMSVIERLFDRMVAYDSVTSGTAQLVYKAHLRTYAVEGLRDIIAMGGPAMQGLTAQIQMIRRFQSNEGITLMDAKDKFETHSYAFSGLPDIIDKFEDQIAGALAIPKVRLFGKSPGGLGSNGDSELRFYFDAIRQQQVRTLGAGVNTLYRIAYMSTFGAEPPPDFTLDFVHLWQMDETEQANVANVRTQAVLGAYEAQVISRGTALRELKQSSRDTGVFTKIDDEEIAQADADPAPTPESLGLVAPSLDPRRTAGNGAAEPDEARPFDS
jgi:phage-related protein (TIGR01555 family)